MLPYYARLGNPKVLRFTHRRKQFCNCGVIYPRNSALSGRLSHGDMLRHPDLSFNPNPWSRRLEFMDFYCRINTACTVNKQRPNSSWFMLSGWRVIDATVKGGERELEGGDPGGVTLGSERWRMNGEADSPTDLEMTAPKNQGEKTYSLKHYLGQS